MKCFIALGSNLGDRRANLERASRALRLLSLNSAMTASPIYQTPALLPPGAAADWDIPFLNAVCEIAWAGTAPDLLKAVKNIEQDMGRASAGRWAPRLIDLDILLYGDEAVDEAGLKIPHPGLWDRAFVLDPLKDIAPLLKIPGRAETVMARARQVAGRAPLWMGILNLTPDSFSDGGALDNSAAFEKTAAAFEDAGVGMIDLGAESTRPGASAVTPDEEWARLSPALAFLKDSWREKIFRPRLSVDTRRAATAEKALDAGADCINDVGGGGDPAMFPLVAQRGCDYVLMHSLSVPADKNVTLPEDHDPVADVYAWAVKKISALEKAGVGAEKIILDPGIGFGKTQAQSLALLRGIDGFFGLGVRVMAGHSRKSFMSRWGDRTAEDRDIESVALSLKLAQKGVDILRVHAPEKHIRAWRAFSEL